LGKLTAQNNPHRESSPSPSGLWITRQTYRLEGVRCGKENCKCASGKLHGPYWYSYTRDKDKVTSQYIGKRLPKGIEKMLSVRSEK
jgi:hypothetical protein